VLTVDEDEESSETISISSE